MKSLLQRLWPAYKPDPPKPAPEPPAPKPEERDESLDPIERTDNVWRAEAIVEKCRMHQNVESQMMTTFATVKGFGGTHEQKMERIHESGERQRRWQQKLFDAHDQLQAIRTAARDHHQALLDEPTGHPHQPHPKGCPLCTTYEHERFRLRYQIR